MALRNSVALVLVPFHGRLNLMAKTLAAGTTDEQRADLYQQIEAQADTDMPVIPIYHYVSPRLVKSYVQGMSKDPLDKFYFKDMSFKK